MPIIEENLLGFGLYPSFFRGIVEDISISQDFGTPKANE